MISAFIIVYLARVGIAFFNIFRTPLPHPADCILLSIFFYNAPLALIAIYGLESLFPEFMVFLNLESRDPGLAQMTMICCFVATIGLDIGRQLISGIKIRENYLLTSQKSLILSVSYLISLCFCIIFIAFLMGFSNYFSGYGESVFAIEQTGYIAVLYFCFEATGIFILLTFLSRNYGNSRAIILTLTLCILFLSFMALARGKRLELVIALLPVFLLLWSVKLRSITSRLLATSAFIVSFSALASLRFGEVPTLSSLAFNSFSEGLYAGHATPGIINAIQVQGLHMEYGARFLLGILAIIPRYFFPAKEVLVYQATTDISQFTPLGATSFLGEAYLQGGMWFILLCFIALGLAAQLVSIEKLYDKNSKYVSVKTIYYVLFVGTFLLHFRDGIIVSLKMTTQMAIIFISFKIFIAQRSLKGQPPT